MRKVALQPMDPTGDPICNRYSLSDGMFYQGCGWPKERAQQYADAINAYDASALTEKDAIEAARKLRIAEINRLNEEIDQLDARYDKLEDEEMAAGR